MRRATWTLLRPTGRVSFALGHGVSSVVIAHERIRGNAALTVHLSRTSLHCPVRAYGGGVLVVTRHRLPLAGFSERQELVSECRELLALFASRPGYVRGWLTSSIDEPDLWLWPTSGQTSAVIGARCRLTRSRCIGRSCRPRAMSPARSRC